MLMETNTYKNSIGKRLRQTVLTLIILGKASKEKSGIYPYDIFKRMSGKGHQFLSGITKNDVYNAISALNSKGLVTGKYHASSGKKYYRITGKGRSILIFSHKVMKKYLKELAEVL